MTIRLRKTKLAGALLATVALTACTEGEPPKQTITEIKDEAPAAIGRFQKFELTMPEKMITAHPDRNAQREAFFGDLHVHTGYSFDAFAFGTLATPYDAYRYARGDAITHPAGFMGH